MATYNKKGTMDVLSLILSQAELKTVTEFGEDKLFDAIDESLRIHNVIAQELFDEFCEVTTDQLRRWGGEITRRMGRLDEYGATDAQKSMLAASNVGFPLHQYGDALQWTRNYFLNQTVQDLVQQFRAIQTADLQNIFYQIKKALFKPTNNLTYVDRLTDSVTLPIRALLNGDGTPIPRNPNTGATFDVNTHTHYLNAATLNRAAVDAAITNVLEHGVRGRLRLVVNTADEATISAVSGFQPYAQANIVLGANTSYAQGAELNPYRPENRPIGIIGAAEVWVKHWWIPNYFIVYDTAPDRKALAFRKRAGSPLAGFGDLQLVYDNENFPLRANQYMREFGISVNDRAAASITYVGGGGVYVEPTISAPF